MTKKRYDAEKFATYLRELINARGLTMRRASLRAGLDHGAVGRFIRGRHPHRDSCLLLAEALQADPNEMLVMAGYEAMPVVDRSLIDPGEFPPDVKEFAMGLLTMSPERRREVFAALRVLLKADMRPA